MTASDDAAWRQGEPSGEGEGEGDPGEGEGEEPTGEGEGEGEACSTAQDCADLVYTSCTCAPDDPCGWGNDGVCDDFCVTTFPPGFDDGGDCEPECASLDAFFSPDGDGDFFADDGRIRADGTNFANCADPATAFGALATVTGDYRWGLVGGRVGPTDTQVSVAPPKQRHAGELQRKPLRGSSRRFRMRSAKRLHRRLPSLHHRTPAGHRDAGLRQLRPGQCTLPRATSQPLIWRPDAT